jgi:large subunit ribosomal protein L18e
MKKERDQYMTNEEITKTIRELKKASKSRDQPVWAALAEELDKSKRSRVAVNLSRINRFSEEGDVVVVPGKVLASGKLGHSVTIAAFDFSESAKNKIVQANGVTKTYSELLSDNSKFKNIKLIK